MAEIGCNVALVSISGELDLYVAPGLRAALHSADQLGTATVVVDLSGVALMDSTACGILVGEAKRRLRHDGQLVLVSSGKHTRRVLEVAGIELIVSVHPTLHAAFQDLLPELVA